MPPRKSIVAIACFVLLSALILSVRQLGKARPDLLGKLVPSTVINEPHAGEKGGNEVTGHPCAKDVSWLTDLDIKYPVKYAEREVVVRPEPGLKRESLTKTDETLFPRVEELLEADDSHLELRDCKPPITLHVPLYPTAPVDASNMIFGIATTLERLEDSRHHIARWLAHTGAKLFVIAIKPGEGDAPTSEQIETKQSVMRDQGMDVTLVTPLSKDETFTESYFSLVKVMYTHRANETTWFVVMDDDTFFPSMQSLQAMLKRYDPAEQYWIGAISESWWSVGRYGMMAFGGAGIFLSRALTAVLDKEYETCTKEMHKAAGGDERIMRCINGHTTTKLTNEPALHQMDISGDLSGVYESGRIPLSLHHWRGGDYPVDLMNLVSDICGDCFLQRWQFGKDTVLTNGFSIADYPEGESADGLDFCKAEMTWDSRTIEESVNPGTAHSMSPSRPRLELDKQKIQYRLVESATVEGSVRQTYIHRGKEDEERDTVLVLYWKREDQQAPANKNSTHSI
ncbi:MAG: hypothetical protein LQ343_002021 [Gyalolechia ehrenbergii]|nr:MAG: hypothetical protein LQ343_002021 [Gyalolechia ehrenbergii]